MESINVAVLTISDSRKEAEDRSGALLKEKIESSGMRWPLTILKMQGYTVLEKQIVIDDIYKIRAQVSVWIASDDCHVIVTTGGTGVTGRDVTPEAVKPLLDKEIEGFGEIFRYLSFQVKCARRLLTFKEIGVSALQSRALCGTANGKYIFCLPGSTNACATAWDKIIQEQLNPKAKGCSLGKLIVRLKEK